MNYSLHQKAGSKFYYVAFRVPIPDPPEKGPKRKLVSRTTGKTTKAEAREAAERIVAAESRAASADMGAARDIAAIVAEAAAKAEKGGLSVAEATRMIARLVEIGGGGKVEVLTLRQWCGRWLASKAEGIAATGGKDRKTGFAENTGKRYAGVVADLLAFLPERADASILLLSAGDVERWRDRLRAEGRSGATVNLFLKVLRTCLGAAVKKGIVLSNVADAVEFLTEADTVRTRFSVEDVVRVLSVAGRDWKGATLISAFGGLSLADAVNLQWKQIDLAAGTLRYTRRKGKKRKSVLEIHLHPELAAWLLAQPAPDDEEAFVLPTLAGKTSGGRSGLSTAFGLLVAEAGVKVEEVEAEGEKGRKRKTLGFHSLRHTFVSGLADAGVAPDLRKALAGHASDAMSERYTHRSSESLRAAVEALPPLPKLESPKGKKGKA
jgi:integrase